jgi:hypothetical protein
MSESSGTTRAGKGDDARVSTYELIRENYETVNFAASTETLVHAASRLVDELPEDTPPAEIIAHWMASAKRDDAARGVIWPEVPPEIMAEAGLAWGLWPNQNILHGVTFVLAYRVRPYGDDPNKCVFESYALEQVERLPRAAAEPAPGAEGDQPPPQPGRLDGRPRCGDALPQELMGQEHLR